VKRIASKSAPSPTSAISAEDATDVVIAWVDGRDPQHRRKRQRYLADPGAMSSRSRWPVKTGASLRPAMEELFEEFQAAFLTNAAYRFRSRKSSGPISTHNHLLLKTSRARVEKPQRSAHFSNRYCLTASPRPSKRG
jgi:hypothetical protein